MKKPFILIILDGWGIAPPSKGNAIALADTSVIDKLSKNYPYTTLNATGRAVGLGENEMGGSEAGHMNIGAGRIVKQDSEYISEAIKTGAFFKNPPLRNAINHSKINKSKLHLMGLLSSKDSPHSDPDHLYNLLKLAKKQGFQNVFLHLFTDGRDTLPRSALKYLNQLELKIEEIGVGEVATVSGRYYAMDRTKKWDRLEKAYRAIALGKGVKATSAKEAIEKAYQKGLKDEFISPTVIVKENGEPRAIVDDNDSIIFFNLRSDRARQFTKFFVSEKIDGYTGRAKKIQNLFFVAMTDFGPDLDCQTAFRSHNVERTLPWALRNIHQLYIAETEKYAHITYFLNGGHPNPVGGEKRIMIASPDVASYDQTPEMSCYDITKVVVGNIIHNVYDFIAINFANPDMVGHTGNLAAAIKAVEAVDECVGEITKEAFKKNGTIFITADHGNVDEMIDFVSGEALTMHSKNPVPFIIVSSESRRRHSRISPLGLRSGGVLGDIAPTILEVMGIEKPVEMTGNSLIIHKS